MADDSKVITLAELIRSQRPLTVLERVELTALGHEVMTPEELRAADLFLKKTAPDLKAVELTGKDGKDLEFVAHLKLIKPDFIP